MRSRYTACTLGALDYLIATHDPATRDQIDYADMGRFIAQAKWVKLEVHSTEAGQAGDSFGRVSFSAHHTLAGEAEVLAEDSLFRRLEGEGDRWVYVGHADMNAS